MIPLALFVIAALWCALAWLHWRKYKREIVPVLTKYDQMIGRTHRQGQATRRMSRQSHANVIQVPNDRR